jgi:hypothetical protein
MRLTDQQKNIVNPFPQTWEDSTIPGTSTGGRCGVYDYSSERNKWIMDGIHDSYISFKKFPKAGGALKRLGPLLEGENIITIADIMAYAALYPQNAIVAPSTSALDKGDPTYNPGPDPLVLKRVPDDEGIEEIVNIFNLLVSNGQVTKFSSLTTNASHHTKYSYIGNQTLTPTILSSSGILGDRLREAYAQQLISFPVLEIDNQRRLEDIRKSFNLKRQVFGGASPFNAGLKDLRNIMIQKNPPTTDLLRWTNNVGPTSQGNRVYFNSVDNHVYYVVRTSSRHVGYYDTGALDSAPVHNRMAAFKIEALDAILNFANIPTSQNRLANLVDRVIAKTTYGDTYRLPPPPGYGVWLLMAKIPVNAVIEFAEMNDLNPLLDNEAPSYTTPLSAYQLSRELISKVSPVNSYVSEVGTLKSNIQKSISVLKHYEDILLEEELGVDVLSGLKLTNQIVQFEGIYSAIESLYAGVGVALNERDEIELKLDDKMRVVYYGVNGNFYFQGLGYQVGKLTFPSLNHEGEEAREVPLPDWLPTDINYFENFSPTAFGLLFYSYQIADLFPRLTGENMPPWTDFLSSYIYPNPNENSWWPSSISSPTTKNKNTSKKSLTKKQIAGHGRGSKKVFKNSKEVQRALQKRTQTRKAIALKVKGAVAGCDVPLAPYLRTGANAYLLLARKGNWKEWVALSIAELKVHLKDNKKFQLMLEDGEKYAAMPSQLERDVNQYVNGQLDQCLTQIGEVVVANIIDPAGNPKNMKSYWRKSNPAKLGKINLRRPSTLNLLSPWWKQMQKLLKSYINQVIASVIMDVLKASLGCGPQPDPTLPQTDKKEGSYGVIQINEILNEDIDPVEIAKSCGLENLLPTQTEGGDLTISITPPTPSQMSQYHQDVSDFLTSEEMLALLDGNASDNTVFSIEEMINKGPIDVSLIPEELRQNETYLSQYQDSLRADDTRYATLGITTDNIIEYFSILGDLINSNDINMPALDVKAALCARRNPDPSGLLNLGLSEAQLIKQVDDEINATLQKIKEKCDLFSAGEGFDAFGDIRSFFEGMPGPSLYQKFLETTTAQSRRAQKALFGESAAAAASTLSVIDEQDTALYKFASEKYGWLMTKPVIQQYPESQGQVWTVNYDLSASPSDNSPGSIYFQMKEDTVEFYLYSQNSETGDWETSLLFTSPLAENNLENAQWGSQYFPRDEVVPFTLRGLSTVSGQSSDDTQYPTTTPEMRDITNFLISPAGQDAASNPIATDKSRRQNRFMTQMSNTGAEGTVVEQIKDFYLTPRAIRRLKTLTDIISAPYFIVTGDVCNPTQEERIATAMMDIIQNHIINFLLNVGPLFRVYRRWNTPDIMNALSFYLATKIMEDAYTKGLDNIYADSLDKIKDTFGTSPDGFRIRFDMDNLFDPVEQLSYILRQSLKVIFMRGSRGRVLNDMLQNIYSDTITEEEMFIPGVAPMVSTEPAKAFKFLMEWFKTGKFTTGAGTNSVVLNSGGAPGGLGALSPLIQSLNEPGGGPNGMLTKLQYYVPVPLIIALQIIYYDKIIDLGGKFPAFRFYYGQRLAASQDGLLSVINGYNSNVFSTPYLGYPVTIEGITYYSESEIIDRIKLLRSQRARIYELEAIFGPLAVYEEDYTPLAYLTGLNDQEQPERLPKDLEAFRNYFNSRYDDWMASYLSLYDTPVKRRNLYKSAIKYKFTSAYPRAFEDGLMSPRATRSPMWLRERAWYERARLLGNAPADESDHTLIHLYKTGYDIEKTNRFVVDGVNVAEKEPPVPEGFTSEPFGTTLLNSRMWMLNSNSYDPDHDTYATLQEWWKDTGYWSITAWLAIATTSLAISLGIISVLVALAGAAVGGVITIATWPVVLVVVIINVAWAFFTWDDEGASSYEDPDDDDSLRQISNAVRWPNNPPGVSGAPLLPVSIEDDFVDAVEWYNTTLTVEGSPVHGNTLDKIALNALYYELGWKSHYYKWRVDPNNETNEMNELRDYVGLEMEEPSDFPMYLALDTDRWFKNDGAPGLRRVYFSATEIQDDINKLRTHPLYLQRDTLNTYFSTLNTLGDKIRAELTDAEEKYKRLQRLPLLEDHILDELRCSLGIVNPEGYPEFGNFQHTSPDFEVTCALEFRQTVTSYIQSQIHLADPDEGWWWTPQGGLTNLMDAMQNSLPSLFNLGGGAGNLQWRRKNSYTPQLSKIANLIIGRGMTLVPADNVIDTVQAEMNDGNSSADPYDIVYDGEDNSTVIGTLYAIKQIYRTITNDWTTHYWGPNSIEVGGQKKSEYKEALKLVEDDIAMLDSILQDA